MNCGSKQRKSVARRQAGCQSGRVCNFGLKSDTREMRGVWSACKHFGPNFSARASTPHLPAMTATHLNTSLDKGYFGCFTQCALGGHSLTLIELNPVPTSFNHIYCFGDFDFLSIFRRQNGHICFQSSNGADFSLSVTTEA